MSPRLIQRRQIFHVGEKIRELRKERQLTQAELATRIGIQQSDLCRMETGEYRVSLDVLFRILGTFGMNFGEFFDEAGVGTDEVEQEVLSMLRRLDRRGREEVLEFLRFKIRQNAGA